MHDDPVWILLASSLHINIIQWVLLLEHESTTGRGWIACTTGAVFLEKPQYYYLVIDMMTFSPERASCLGLQLSVRNQMVTPKSQRASYHLSTIRFTWSDWNEINRILQLDTVTNGYTRATSSPSLWTDAWLLCEDVSRLHKVWTGRTWRNNRHGLQESWTEAEEDRSFDSPVRVRAYGEGIEGRSSARVGGPARSRLDRQAAKQNLHSP
ncbi:hypothetical protein BJV77DRAFT_1064524 [Russula vinacea]|nr:hypothetical protein BJV77DRAFT_1064524 [Russula vinacea]